MPPMTHPTFLFFSPPAVKTACQELGWHWQVSSLCELSHCLSFLANRFLSCLSDSDIKLFFLPPWKPCCRRGEESYLTGAGRRAYGWSMKALAVKMDGERTGGDVQWELSLPDRTIFSLWIGFFLNATDSIIWPPLSSCFIRSYRWQSDFHVTSCCSINSNNQGDISTKTFDYSSTFFLDQQVKKEYQFIFSEPCCDCSCYGCYWSPAPHPILSLNTC